MMTMKTIGLGAAAAAGLVLGAGFALANDTGMSEYATSCAVCHGADGTGDGPMAAFLTLDVPDLTVLAEQNDGVFPMLKVIQIIDGRTGVRGHGDARPDAAGNMPVWGEKFRVEAEHEAGEYGAELLVRGRILSLAQYLESIQK